MRPVLRDYQEPFVDRLRQAMRSHRRVLAVLPTGGGKTVVAGAIIDLARNKGSRVVVMAHRTELLDQMSAKLDDYGIDHGVIKRGHKRENLTLGVQVASVQTLARRVDSLASDGPDVPTWRRPPDLLVVDEAHHQCAGSYVKIEETWKDTPILGLTATPYRLDGAGLGDHFDVLEVGAHVSELISNGYLVPTRTFAPVAPDALKRVKKTAGDYNMGGATGVMDQVGPIQEIVRTWQKHASDRITVAFACSVNHAEHLAEAFRVAGVPAAAIDGSTPDEERSHVLKSLRRGELRVVCNVMLLTEGWDLPSCSAVIQARPTQSQSLWRQMVGRGMRSFEGKGNCMVLDHVGNCHRFGQPDEDDVYSLHGSAEKEVDPGVACYACSALNPANAEACVECGALFHHPERGGIAGRDRSWRSRQRIEMQMAEITQPADADERWKFYAEQVEKAKSSGFDLGWAAHRYREKFHDWPPFHFKRRAGALREAPKQRIPQSLSGLRLTQDLFA